MTEGGVPRVKLHPPRLPAGRIPRPRLIARLDEGLEQDIILITAPAGYGKTTLVCQWLQNVDLPSAWLSLDARDRDLPQFAAGLTAAIQTVHPECCGSLVGLAGPQGLSPAEAVAHELGDELDDAREFILVLDDCDAIREGGSSELLRHLVHHMPRALHLVLVCRREPALPVGGLRGAGRLAEVRMQHLRFSEDEAAIFLQRSTGAEFGDAQVASLVERTEGWIAALNLAALSLRDHENGSALIQELAASDRYVADYLMHEIFARLAEPVREYLLSTAILERLCRPLSRAVIGPDAIDEVDGTPMLEWLHDANLFVVSLGGDGAWFRYHHLFRDLLMHRLGLARTPDEIAELHRRAGEWLAGRRQIDAALDHLLAAGDISRASEMVASERAAGQEDERWSDLDRWTHRLPREAIDQEPNLLLAEAWGYHLQQAWDDMRRVLDRVGRLLVGRAPSPDGDLLQSEIEALRSEIFYWQGDGERALAAARRAIELSGSTGSRAWALATVIMCGGLQLQGDIRGARTVYHQLLNGEEEATFPPRALVGLALLELMEGDLTAALQVTDRMEREATKAGMRDTVGFAHMFRGFIRYQRNDLNGAEADFLAVSSRPFRAHVLPLKECLFGLACVQQARGAPAQAAEIATKAADILARAADPHLELQARCVQVRLELLEGRSVAVAGWLAALGESPATDNLNVVFELPALTLALALISGDRDEDLDRAEDLLARLCHVAERSANTFRQIQIGTLRSLLHERRSQRQLALDTLARAIELGRPGGFIRVYADFGAPMLALLEGLSLRGRHVDYLRSIIDAVAPTQRAKPSSRAPNVHADTRAMAPDIAYLLTNRELDVLALLDQRLSNKEIARRLVISPATVKRHTLSIYRKLEVAGRRQASMRAHELGLLPLS